MYQFISVDEPRGQYTSLVRSREQKRLERQFAREGRREGGWKVRLMRRFLGRRRVARAQIVRRAVGA